MWLGIDYHPEQWDESMMEADMDNIVELGSNVIRISEFSWHLMEKKEGEFDFSFFDRVIAKARAAMAEYSEICLYPPPLKLSIATATSFISNMPPLPKTATARAMCIILALHLMKRLSPV